MTKGLAFVPFLVLALGCTEPYGVRRPNSSSQPPSSGAGTGIVTNPPATETGDTSSPPQQQIDPIPSNNSQGSLMPSMGNGSPSDSSASSAGNPPADAGISVSTSIVAGHSSKCLDVKDSSMSAGALVQQWDCAQAAPSNQLWNFVLLNNGYSLLRSNASGKCINIRADFNANGAAVEQSDCDFTGVSRQMLFLPIRVAAGKYMFQMALGRKCLDVKDGSHDNGASIQIWDCSTSQPTNQVFTVGIDVPARASSALEPSPNDFNDTRFLRGPHYGATSPVVATHSNKCLDLKDGSMATGALIQQWDCAQSMQDNQVWEITVLDIGYAVIQSKSSRLCLSVRGNSSSSAALIEQGPCDLSGAKREMLFKPIAMGGNKYMFQVALSRKCLDVKDVSPLNGAQVQQYDCSSQQANQIFQLSEAIR